MLCGHTMVKAPVCTTGSRSVNQRAWSVENTNHDSMNPAATPKKPIRAMLAWTANAFPSSSEVNPNPLNDMYRQRNISDSTVGLHMYFGRYRV